MRPTPVRASIGGHLCGARQRSLFGDEFGTERTSPNERPDSRHPHGRSTLPGRSDREPLTGAHAKLARRPSPTFDETPLSKARVDELDKRYAASVLRRDAPLTVQQLTTLHALERSGGGTHPTVRGYLLFRREVEPHRMPDAWVQCGRFSGTDRSTIADSRRIDGRLVELVDQSDGLVID
jgi:ATP-dependent DNA helicase RecG